MPKRRVYKRDRRGRFAHAASSGSRPNRKAVARPRTRAQQAERNRVIARRVLLTGVGLQHAGRAYATARLVPLSAAVGQHHVTTAAGVKLATGAAVAANDLHNIHRLTSREFTTGVRPGARNRQANEIARSAHITRYERRKRHLGRADNIAGWGLAGAGLLSLGNVAATAYSPKVRAWRQRRNARSGGLPRTASTGGRRFGNRATPRGGVYSITSAPRASRVRRSRAGRQAASLAGLRIRGVRPTPRRRK